MEVRDGFAGVGAVVHDEAVAVGELESFRHGAGDEQEVAEEGLVGVGGLANARDGLLWNNEQMDGRLRLDVVQDDTERVLVFDPRGDFAVDDFFEKGFGHKPEVEARTHRGH